MAEFKLCIAEPVTGKAYPREVKDNNAKPFVGMKLGQAVKGEAFDMPGYEFVITGGSDSSGFPMRSGIQGMRKRIYAYEGTGLKRKAKGILQRKTVCGATIHAKISQINLKVTKAGNTPLAGESPAGKPEEKKEAAK